MERDDIEESYLCKRQRIRIDLGVLMSIVRDNPEVVRTIKRRVKYNNMVQNRNVSSLYLELLFYPKFEDFLTPNNNKGKVLVEVENAKGDKEYLKVGAIFSQRKVDYRDYPTTEPIVYFDLESPKITQEDEK